MLTTRIRIAHDTCHAPAMHFALEREVHALHYGCMVVGGFEQ
jgi:hypothetical protein